MKLLFGQTEAFAVGAVHHQDDDLKGWERSALLRRFSPTLTPFGFISYLCVAVVRVPAGSKALLPPDIPDQKVRFAHGDLLNVASDGGRRVDSFFSQTVNVLT